MSGRGIDFLENWIQQNVTETDKKGSRERAKELAEKCIIEAAANGITIDDMEPEWGSVKSIIYEAMQDILGEELEFWKAAAALRDRRERNETLH
jgi:cytosine/adenosine deaminase-related metal-dependent hydrolase